MVDLELYRIYKVVADEGNITNASKKLSISQPAVTKHIRNLENILHIKLFERTNRGLNLTLEGKKIYEEINMPIQILENIYNKYSTIKTINLGIHSTMLNKLFSKTLARYYSQFENTKIKKILLTDVRDIIMWARNSEMVVVEEKGNGDSATIADVKIGELFSNLLPQLLPNSIVINEEDFDEEVFETMKNTRYVWVVDPIDGTKAFRTRGNNEYCVGIGLLDNNNPVLSLYTYFH